MTLNSASTDADLGRLAGIRVLDMSTVYAAPITAMAYTGEWLPEPLIEDPTPTAAEHTETADSLTTRARLTSGYAIRR